MGEDSKSGSFGAAAKPLYILVFVIFVDFLCYSLGVPVLLAYVSRMNSTNVPDDVFVLGTLILTDLAQIAAMPIVGGLSDRIGRRPVLIVSMCGLVLSCALRAAAGDLVVFLFASFLYGAMSANVSTAFAAVADIALPSTRLRMFSWLTAALNSGYILGPVVGGVLAVHSLRTPLWTAVALSALGAAVVALLFRETLATATRSRRPVRYANPARYLAKARGIRLAAIARAYTLHQLAIALIPLGVTLYVAHRHSFDPPKIGLFLTLISLTSFFAQLFLVGPLTRRLGEVRSAVTSLLVGGVGFALFGLSPAAIGVWIAAMLMPLRTVASPIMASQMSALTPQSEQGSLQGANAALTSVTRVLVQLALVAAFSSSSRDVSNLAWSAPFLAAALLLVASAGLMLRHRSASDEDQGR